MQRSQCEGREAAHPPWDQSCLQTYEPEDHEAAMRQILMKVRHTSHKIRKSSRRFLAKTATKSPIAYRLISPVIDRWYFSLQTDFTYSSISSMIQNVSATLAYISKKLEDKIFYKHGWGQQFQKREVLRIERRKDIVDTNVGGMK